MKKKLARPRMFSNVSLTEFANRYIKSSHLNQHIYDTESITQVIRLCDKFFTFYCSKNPGKKIFNDTTQHEQKGKWFAWLTKKLLCKHLPHYKWEPGESEELNKKFNPELHTEEIPRVIINFLREKGCRIENVAQNSTKTTEIKKPNWISQNDWNAIKKALFPPGNLRRSSRTDRSGDLEEETMFHREFGNTGC